MKTTAHVSIKSFVSFLVAGFFLVSMVTGTLVGARSSQERQAQQIIQELDRLDLLKNASSETIANLIDYQWQSGKSLAQILEEPLWCSRLGLTFEDFKVTWYMSNPYEMLPADLQEAIRKRKEPFQSITHVWQWCRSIQAPKRWRDALYYALIETTPKNLSRAANGERPYARNGEYIEPIVIDHGRGRFEVRDGHIATDPRVIPTNTTVLLLVKVDGEDRILRVKATDIGGGIKGKHVDLPIHLSTSETEPLPHSKFPKSVSNPRVRILTPIPMVVFNPNQKA